MAYVKILKIRSRRGVGNAARYVNDKEKTDASKREKSPDPMNERARLLVSKEQEYIVDVLNRWIGKEC